MRVEFYLTTVMEITHLAPVVHVLRAMDVDATFVSPRDDPKSKARGWYDANGGEALLKQLEMSFAGMLDPNADVAVTIQEGAILEDYRNRKVRMMYGCGLIPPTGYMIPVSNGFDSYLVHGAFSQRVQFLQHSRPSELLSAERVKSIGYPRFDRWFKYPHALRAPWPTILYLPTWQARSSVETFSDAIFGLADRYQILVKPHHCTYGMEVWRMQKLAAGPVQMLSFTAAPEDTFALADVVLADISSGAFTEAILAEKKVVCLAKPEEVENLLLPELAQYVPICLSPDDLAAKVNEALKLDYSDYGLAALRSEMFDTSEGADAIRAARAIIECTDG